MGLIDRDYMYENREDKTSKNQKDKLQQELFNLYGKKEKSLSDRQRIKQIENEFLNNQEENKKPSFIKACILIALLILMFYQPISEFIANLILSVF